MRAEMRAEQPGQNSAFVRQVGTLEVRSCEPPVPVVDVLNALIAKQTAVGIPGSPARDRARGYTLDIKDL